MRKLLFIAIACITSISAIGQTNDYWVFYKDKDLSKDIRCKFDKKAIDRRTLEGINFDATDYPVNNHYEQQVSAIANNFLGSTKWFNASYVKANENEIAIISNLPFVLKVEPAAVWEQNPLCTIEDAKSQYENYSLLISQQTSMFQPYEFYDRELDGKGVRIAVLDGGFPSVDTHIAFEHIRKEDRIKGTYDFVKDQEYAYHGNSHGTSVLSNIAGVYNDQKMGLAQQSEFLLARTEKNSEPFVEEIYWLKAVEWADEKGADIINSSLGYTYNRYFQSDMDGKTSLVSRAANKAAHKGILVFNSAGNEGTDEWTVIGTPADADSILSIGGVRPDTKTHIDFSSYGPTADGRLKPNISASGKAVTASANGNYGISYGTSFASPLACGFGACVKQAFPELTVMELKAKIESCANLYPYFDYAHGYGIPLAGKLFNEDTSTEMVEITTDNKFAYISINAEYFYNLGYYGTSVLFYHIMNKDNTLDSYKVIKTYKRSIARIPIRELKGKTLQVHFNGFTSSKEF